MKSRSQTGKVNFCQIRTGPSFPNGSVGKESACNVGGPGFIPAWGTSPGEGNGNPLQYSFPENCMDRGAWRTAAHGITESDMTE